MMFGSSTALLLRLVLLRRVGHGTPVLEVEATGLRKYAKLTNVIYSTPFDQMLAMRLENLSYEPMTPHQPIGSQLLAYLGASRATLEKKRKPRFVNLEHRGPSPYDDLRNMAYAA